MKQFDFYEFTGILVPGATVLTGAVVLFPGWGLPALIKDTSIGGLGVFIVLAYVLGHLVQAVGNGIESIWWKIWGGMPTDWLRTKPDCLLAPSQLTVLEKAVKERLGLDGLQISHSTAGQWYAVTRQVYAEVAGAGRAARIDVFNGNYGLNRGIGAGLLVVLVIALINWPVDWTFAGGVTAALALAIYRMHRFARHYAREVFVQFLQLPAREFNKENKQ
jgi:hypothetical protein